MPIGATDNDVARAATGFRTDIEGLRAIAVAAVTLYHAAVPGFGGGYVGVDVFFVISGFLITAQLVRDDTASFGARLVHFYSRRARRIVPAATLVIVATLGAVAVVGSPLVQPTARHDGLAAMFFFANIRFARLATDYFHQDAAPSFFQHFWSLSFEEQFYLLWPALLLVVGLTPLRRRREMRVLAVAVVGAVSLAASIRLTDTAPSSAFFLLPARAWELCVGAGLTLLATRLRPSAQWRPLLRGAGLLAIGGSVVAFDNGTPFPGTAALVPVMGAALIIAAGLHPQTDRDAGRVLTWRGMQLGGRYSYSIYLWHWPVLLVGALVYADIGTEWSLAVAVTAAVTIPLAVGSYHLVEHPFRTAFHRRPDVHALVAGAAVLALGGCAFVPYAALARTDADAGRAAPVAAAGSTTPTPFVPSNLQPMLLAAHGFDPSIDLQTCSPVADACRAGDPNGTRTVVLYGDSHARHWITALDAAGDANGWRVVGLTASGCRSFDEPPHKNDTCPAFRRAANKTIEQMRPALVLFSNQSAGLFQTDRAAFRDSVRRAVRALPAGTRVAIVGQSPRATEDVPLCLADHLRTTAACEPARHVPVIDGINDDLRALANELGAGFVDLTPWMCTDARCPAIVGNVLVYRDHSHLTPEFTLTRVDQLAAAVRAALD